MSGRLAVLLLPALLLGAGRAEAAACCLSSSAFGAGRLAIWEQLALGVSAGVTPGLGTWGPDGQWQRYSGGYAEAEARLTAWGIVRLHERVEASLSVPWVASQRRAGGLTERSAVVGDVAAGVRYEALPIGAYVGLPGVAFHLGVSAPTGRDSAHSRTPLGSDVAGRGAWVVSGATSLEYAHQPWFVRLDVGVLVPLATDNGPGGISQRHGPGVEVLFGGGVELLAERLVLSLVPRLSWESARVEGGQSVPDSGGYELTLGPAAAWKLTPRWTVQASATTGVFLDGLGDNRPGRLGVSLGLRRAFF